MQKRMFRETLRCSKVGHPDVLEFFPDIFQCFLSQFVCFSQSVCFSLYYYLLISVSIKRFRPVRLVRVVCFCFFHKQL